MLNDSKIEFREFLQKIEKEPNAIQDKWQQFDKELQELEIFKQLCEEFGTYKQNSNYHMEDDFYYDFPSYKKNMETSRYFPMVEGYLHTLLDRYFASELDNQFSNLQKMKMIYWVFKAFVLKFELWLKNSKRYGLKSEIEKIDRVSPLIKRYIESQTKTDLELFYRNISGSDLINPALGGFILLLHMTSPKSLTDEALKSYCPDENRTAGLTVDNKKTLRLALKELVKTLTVAASPGNEVHFFLVKLLNDLLKPIKVKEDEKSSLRYIIQSRKDSEDAASATHLKVLGLAQDLVPEFFGEREIAHGSEHVRSAGLFAYPKGKAQIGVKKSEFLKKYNETYSIDIERRTLQEKLDYIKEVLDVDSKYSVDEVFKSIEQEEKSKQLNHKAISFFKKLITENEDIVERPEEEVLNAFNRFWVEAGNYDSKIEPFKKIDDAINVTYERIKKTEQNEKNREKQINGELAEQVVAEIRSQIPYCPVM